MRRIFIDLEMNPVSGEYADFRKQCRSEVIEIGAVVMDEQMHITDQFREYVKPEYNSVVLKKITRLTGISTETVSEADSFKSVFLRFLAWCGAEDYEMYIPREKPTLHGRFAHQSRPCSPLVTEQSPVSWTYIFKIYCWSDRSALHLSRGFCGINPRAHKKLGTAVYSTVLLTGLPSCVIGFCR